MNSKPSGRPKVLLRRTGTMALMAAVFLCAVVTFATPYHSAAKHKKEHNAAAESSKVLKGLPIRDLTEDEAILHALNRLGYGPRPGEIERVKQMGLAAFSQDLGDRMEDIVLVTMSEFGRTAHENGDRGTDHGYANCMFVLDGQVRGGGIYGKWPGLGPEELNQGRDLKFTTDFRSVLGEILTVHLGSSDLQAVFPGFDNSPEKFPRLLQA